MSPLRRIRTIYTKELVELLRDHRTLIAMIIVPIALYPLLILGSVNLLSVQEGARKITKMRIAVPEGPQADEPGEHEKAVFRLLQQAHDLLEARRRGNWEDEVLAEQLASIKAMEVGAVPDVKEAVAGGAYQVGVVIERVYDERFGIPQDRITIYFDGAEVRSESASDRIRETFRLVAENLVEHNLREARIPRAVIEPLEITLQNVATPKKIGGMILGSIVPLVLVLMTITGAIYPAIDLTAGERERGTLETLIACPVPAMELITGKYLVVTTVALMGAALNLLSMGATLYFGGFTEMIGQSGETELPLGVLPIILLALVPFALLFSAVMVAVCSYARTFKEAQNYIMPVILAALIPGGIAALPGSELTGISKVVPVMNMVLLARELLLGNFDAGTIALVMVSTSLYAAAAVVLASRVYSTESVVFADTVSMRAMLRRRTMRPSPQASISLVLIVTALLFPTWMFIQVGLQPDELRSLFETFADTAKWMPLCLVLLPMALLVYFKIDVGNALSLQAPPARYLVAALLIGLAGWVPAHELFVLQNAVWKVPDYVTAGDAQLREAFAERSLLLPLLLIALVPAVCEELYFRGFLLSGLRTGVRKWPAILLVACVFAIFHIMLVKFFVTAALGIVLGLLAWQSRSVWPAMLAHLLHNGTAVLIAFWPPYTQTLGIGERGVLDHLPAHIIVGGIVVVAAGLAIAIRRNPAPTPPPISPPL
jgi:ABC-type Na+ efflux pump permease subunit/membrane protease YdiL (CAAX protease family)